MKQAVTVSAGLVPLDHDALPVLELGARHRRAAVAGIIGVRRCLLEHPCCGIARNVASASGGKALPIAQTSSFSAEKFTNQRLS